MKTPGYSPAPQDVVCAVQAPTVTPSSSVWQQKDWLQTTAPHTRHRHGDLLSSPTERGHENEEIELISSL